MLVDLLRATGVVTARVLEVANTALFQASVQTTSAMNQMGMVDETFLTELPLDLWKRILTIACTGSDADSQNTILTTLRVCSKTMRDACDSCRTHIILSSQHIASSTAYLGRLKSLVHVTIHMGDGSTRGKNLQRLSGAVPGLTSLTMKQGPNFIPQEVGKRYSVKDMCAALDPFRDNLVHLIVKDCNLTYGTTLTWLSKPVTQNRWSPDLPALRSLTMQNCKLTFLNLFRCPNLQKLEIIDNPLLIDLSLQKANNLHTIVCKDNPELYMLDLSGCLSLLLLECHENISLFYITLPDKKGIEFLF